MRRLRPYLLRHYTVSRDSAKSKFERDAGVRKRAPPMGPESRFRLELIEPGMLEHPFQHQSAEVGVE